MSIQEQLTSLLSTPDAFETWLKGQGETELNVGTECGCPIAEFLNQQLKIEVKVGIRSVYVGFSDSSKPDILYRYPNWVRRFITKVDNRKARTITAARALTILQAVRKELSL